MKIYLLLLAVASTIFLPATAQNETKKAVYYFAHKIGDIPKSEKPFVAGISSYSMPHELRSTQYDIVPKPVSLVKDTGFLS